MKTLTEAVKACGGVWPSTSDDHIYLEDFITGQGWLTVSSNEPKEYICTRAEFESHATELSGKPGWGEAPEDARILVQQDDGRWVFGSYKSAYPGDAGGWQGIGDGKWLTYSDGTVLGDWRDTLERRPEASAEAVPPAPMWIPPAGIECEQLWTSPDKYYRVKIFGYDGDEAVGKWLEGPRAGELFSDTQHGNGPVDCPSHFNFRPLKSDRDRWVDAARDKGFKAGPAGRMYDALKSGELPAP